MKESIGSEEWYLVMCSSKKKDWIQTKDEERCSKENQKYEAGWEEESKKVYVAMKMDMQ